MNRRVLIVSCFFPPLGGGGVQRALKLVRYLPRFGWTPEVLAAESGGGWLRDPALLDELPASLPVHRVGASLGTRAIDRVRAASHTAESGARPDHLFNLARLASGWVMIPDSYMPWARRARRRARALLATGRFDAVVTTSPPESAHFVVLPLRDRPPWLADFRDPWTQRLHFQPPTRVHRRLDAELEAKVVTGADHIVLVTDPMHDDFARRYPSRAAHMHTITNGFDPADFPGPDPSIDAARPLRLLHTGTLTLRRTVAPLVQTVERLRRRHPQLEDDLQIELLGGRDANNDRMIQSARLERVITTSPGLGHGQVVVRQRRAQALLLIDAGGPGSELTLPGKLFEYLGARRPIFAFGSHDGVGRILRETGAGVCFGPDETGAAADELGRWIADARAGRRRELGASASVDRYSRVAVAEHFAAALDAMVSK